MVAVRCTPLVASIIGDHPDCTEVLLRCIPEIPQVDCAACESTIEGAGGDALKEIHSVMRSLAALGDRATALKIGHGSVGSNIANARAIIGTNPPEVDELCAALQWLTSHTEQIEFSAPVRARDEADAVASRADCVLPMSLLDVYALAASAGLTSAPLCTVMVKAIAPLL